MESKDLWRMMAAPALAAALLLGSVTIADAADNDASRCVGIDAVLKQSYKSGVIDNMNLYLTAGKEGEVFNLAFYDGEDDFIRIRKNPDEGSALTGKLYRGNAVRVLKYLEGWSKINSGNAYGYVPTNLLLTGKAAREYDSLQVGWTAEVTADVLNVREKASITAPVLTVILNGERHTVFKEPENGWYHVTAGDVCGWVYGEYISLEKDYKYGESKEEEEKRLAKEAATAKGRRIAEFACRFIGNPYVWGGTSLTDGADCSGFVQSVYKNFGISLPRTTWDLEYVGRPVSFAEALPGDLVLYEGHVGLYLGDGNIVNAMCPERGIAVVNARYAPIKTIRRIL